MLFSDQSQSRTLTSPQLEEGREQPLQQDDNTTTTTREKLQADS